MKRPRLAVIAVSLVLFCGFTALAFAQTTSASTSPSGAVPTLINYSGVLKDSTGKTLTSVTGVTFLIYTDEQGGSPLWLETQNVTPDRSGHYTVQLGSTTATGLPTDLFQNGEARWLAVQVADQAEQPRIMLLSVPYAMKAGDAQTIGGLPPSAFVLAPSPGSNNGELAGTSTPGGSNNAITRNGTSDVTTAGGTVNAIPLFSTSTNIQNSILSQNGTSAVSAAGNLSATGELAAGGAAGGHTAKGTVEVDAGNTNNGSYLPGLSFGGGGESIASNRAGTANKDGIDFYTKDARRMSITNGGDVGIATATPSHLLEVDGTTSTTTAQIAMVSPGTDAAISLKNTNTANGGREYWIDSGSGAAGIGSGNFAVWDDTALAARFVIGPTGNVGIGTTSPGAPLDVVSSSPFGIYASDSANPATGSSAAAIYGEATATSGAAWGVEGVTASGDENGYGVYGLANNTDPLKGGIGVYGQSYAYIGTGVFGQYGTSQSETGLIYIGYPMGMWADSGKATPTFGFALVATADDTTAGFFVNNASDAPTLSVEADNSTGTLFTASNFANSESCTIDQNANLTCSGSVSGVVPVDGGSRQLAVSAIASPKNWFEDFGSGQLVNGLAVITLDSDFIQTVNTEIDYKVFPVPNGDCKGLYVTHKTATSFEVRELGGGMSNVAFDYRITALRKRYENVRFADHTAETQKQRETAERMHARKGNGQSHDPQHNPLLMPSVSPAIRPQAELQPAAVR